MRSSLVVVVVTLCWCSATANRSRKCGTDALVENADVNVSACGKLPCKLKRGTNITVEVKFKSEETVQKLTNSVHAKILGVPFPFIGVDGNNICGKIFDTQGAKAACPLTAGQEYVYKDYFPVLDIYPKIRVWVHWAFLDQGGKEVTCFEVPVRITA